MDKEAVGMERETVERAVREAGGIVNIFFTDYRQMQAAMALAQQPSAQQAEPGSPMKAAADALRRKAELEQAHQDGYRDGFKAAQAMLDKAEQPAKKARDEEGDAFTAALRRAEKADPGAGFAIIWNAALEYAARQSAEEARGVRPTDDALWDQTIEERDRYHETADDLAAQIAAITGVEIGEHSSINDPWLNAMLAADDFIASQIRALLAAPAADKEAKDAE